MADMKMATPRLADDRGVKVVGSASRCLFDIYLKDGQEFLGQEDYKNAISSYNKALEIKSGDSTALVARSWCYLKMGKRYAALRDAETVLEGDVMNIEAMHAKAEVLFQSGNFELSLIYFHRGLKQRPKSKAFLDGVEKSQEAVLKFGGSNRGYRVSTAGDLSLFMRKKHPRKGNLDTERSARADVPPPISDRTHDRTWKPAPDDFRSTFYRPLARITKKPGLSHFRSVTNHSERCSSEVSHMTGTQPTDGAALKQILGQLYTDKKYLQNLYQSVGMSMKNKGSISDLAESGINFLQERGTYWDKLGPLPPPQPNRRLYQRKHGSTSVVPSSVYSFTTNPPSGTIFTSHRVDALSSIVDVNFSFMSHEPDEDNSVAMDTDSHGNGASINMFWESEASVASMGGSTREATRRQRSYHFAQELETIEKLYTQGRFTDCSECAEACLAEVQAADEGEITQKRDILATLHSYIGNAAACRGKYSKAEFHHAKDLEIGELDDMPEVSSRALGNLGRMYCSQRKYNKALDVLARKAPLCTTPREVAWVFLEIGTCFMALGYHDYARDCGEKVLSVARYSDMEDELFQAQLLVASSEEKMKKYEMASRSFSTALGMAIARDDKMAEYAIRNEMKKIEKKLAFVKSRQRQEVTSPRQHILADKMGDNSFITHNVERQFENTNHDNNQTETLAHTSISHAAAEQEVSELARPTDTLAELDEYVYKEFDGVTILSVLQRLREESNTSSTHTISEYQESEAEKLDDIASDLDQIDSPHVKRRPSMKKRGSFVRRKSKNHLSRHISFKLWDEKDNLFEHSEEGLKSTERDGASTGRTLSNRERAALTIREKTSRIRYQKMDTDWTPRDIDLAKYSRDELEKEKSFSEKLDGNVVAAALAESGYLDLIKMVGSKFDIGCGIPNTDVDNYTPDPEKQDELQTTIINDEIKIMPSEKPTTDSAPDNITNQSLKLDEYSEVHAALCEEDSEECETPIFLYPQDSESFSCPFDDEFVVDEEDVMVVSTSGIIQGDQEPNDMVPRRLSVVYEDVTEKFKEPSESMPIITDEDNRLEADQKDMTLSESLDAPKRKKPELKPVVHTKGSEPGVSGKSTDVASAPKNTPRSKTTNKSFELRVIPKTNMKVSNRNRQVRLETDSDKKGLSTPRGAKSRTESKSIAAEPKQLPTNQDSKETPRGRITNRRHNVTKGDVSTEKKVVQPGGSSTPRYRSQLKSDPKTAKHKEDGSEHLQQEQTSETGTRKQTSNRKRTLYKSKFHDSVARKPESRKIPEKYGRRLVLPDVQKTRTTKSMGNSKLGSETSAVVNNDEKAVEREDREGEATVDDDNTEKPVVLSFAQRLKSFLGIFSLRKPQPLPKIQEAEKDNDSSGKAASSNTDPDVRNTDLGRGVKTKSLDEEMKDDEEMFNEGSEENQGASEMRTGKAKLLPVLKDSPYTKVARSPRTKAKLQMVTVKPKTRRQGVRGSRGRSVQLTQSNRRANRTNVGNSQTSPRNQSVTERGGASSSNTIERTNDIHPRNEEESRESVIQRSEIPSFIKKRNLLYQLSNKDGKILFTPLESTEPKNKWKVVYMRVRKGEKQFTVPVIQEPSETETGSAETQGISTENVKPPQKPYPMRKQSKKQFRKRMTTNLGNVPEEWESDASPKPRKSPRNAKPVTIPKQDDTDLYKANKIDINDLATIFENKNGLGKRLSASGETTGSDMGVKLRVPRGQEVVYRQTDREGNIVLVPEVRTPAHKIVLVRVKRKDQTFVLPIIVEKTQ